MKSVNKSLVNTFNKDNGQRTIKAITKTFSTAVKQVNDPRTWEVDDPLVEILFTALVAVCCGGGFYDDVATFAEQQLRWLRKFFPFKNGTPSHDTFNRVFDLLDPHSLEKAYRLLVEGLKIRNPRHIAIGCEF